MTLTDRLRAATGPDRELDLLIHEASGRCAHRSKAATLNFIKMIHTIQRDGRFTCKDCGDDFYGFSVPYYTASIDAAVTLIPDGMQWQTSSFGETAVIAESTPSHWTKYSESDHDNPAIAICIAALEQIQSMTQKIG